MKTITTITLAIVFATTLMTSALAGDNSNSKGTPSLNANPDLLAAVESLAEKITELEESGQLKHGQTQSLLNKLEKAARALEESETASGDISAQQLSLQDLGKVLKAITAFLRELTQIVTDLPAEVVQPIIDATLDLIDQIIDLLLP
jgi:hypothetical protein